MQTQALNWCVVVKGLSTYAKLTCKSGFLFTGSHTCAKLRDPLRGQ